MKPSSMLLAAVLACAAAPAQGAYTWHVNPANGHSYALTPPMTWSQAEAEAVVLGGHLATVRNAAEHSWLVQTFGVGSPEDTRIWFGLTDEAVEGTWVWSSGEALSYTNWGLWEPDNAGGNQNYAGLWLIPSSFGGGWGWFDSGPIDYRAIIELQPPMVPATVSAYGSGCGSPPVQLSPSGGSRPIVGQSQISDINNASLGFAFVAWGLSNASWGPLPIPVSLDPFGFEGCQLWQSAEQDLASSCVGTSLNTAQHVLPIPFLPGIVGVHVYLQAWTLQPSFNSIGIVLSNGLDLTIGDV